MNLVDKILQENKQRQFMDKFEKKSTIEELDYTKKQFEENFTMPDSSALTKDEIDDLLTSLSDGDTLTDEEKVKNNKIYELEGKFALLRRAVKNANDEEFKYLEKVVDEAIKYMMNNEKVKKDYDYIKYLKNSYDFNNYDDENLKDIDNYVLKRTKKVDVNINDASRKKVIDDIFN